MGWETWSEDAAVMQPESTTSIVIYLQHNRGPLEAR